MPRLTSYEATLADTWDQGTAETDQADEARELAGMRDAWSLLDTPA